MSYRQSSFDPSAGGDYGPPLRPYNWVQWTGVGFMGAGFVLLGGYLAARAGWIALDTKDTFVLLGTNLCMCGSILVSSRRQPGTLSPETKRRRSQIILAAAAICALVAADIIYFKGA
jgi:hypothetical protein